MEEIWKPVVGYEGLYEVSNFGRVRSLNYNRQKGKIQILKNLYDQLGYTRVWLVNKERGCRRAFLIHRLVAQAFLPNPNNLPCVNHKDENPRNNIVTNLEWCSVKYNTNYGTGRQRQVDKVSKPVRMLSLDGIPLKVFPSANEAARSFGKKASSHICDVANGVKWHTTAYGYRWEWA